MADPTGFVLNIAIQAAIALAIAALRPKQEIEGPRLEDTSISSAAYGKFITLGYGSDIVGGNIIWGQEIEEVAKEYDIGKGNPFSLGTRTEYKYYLTCAVGISQREVKALLGIYADGKLIYDAEAIDGKPSGNLHPFLDNVSEADRVDDDGNERAPPLIEDLEFNFYNGTLDQLADPIMAEDVGEEVCPAYRGLAYIVFNRMPLKDLGNRVPQFRFVVTWGDPEESALTFRNMGSDDPLYTLTTTRPVVYDRDRGVLYAFKRGANGLDEQTSDSVYLEAADNVTGDQLAFSFETTLDVPNLDQPQDSPISGEAVMLGVLGDYLIGNAGKIGLTFYSTLIFYDKDTLAVEGRSGAGGLVNVELGDTYLGYWAVPNYNVANLDGGINAVYVPTQGGIRAYVLGGPALNAGGPNGDHLHSLAMYSANAGNLGTIVWYENDYTGGATGLGGPDEIPDLLPGPTASSFTGYGYKGFVQGRTVSPGVVEGVLFMAENPDESAPGGIAYLVTVTSGGTMQASGIQWEISAGQLTGIGQNGVRGIYLEDENFMVLSSNESWVCYDLNRSSISDNGGTPPIIWQRDDLIAVNNVADSYSRRQSGGSLIAQLGSFNSGDFVRIDPPTGNTSKDYDAPLFTAGDGLATNYPMMFFDAGQQRGLVSLEQPGETSVYGWQYLEPALTRGVERLSTVVEDIVTRGDLTSADIDVTDLEEIFVKGYVIGRNTTYRSALEPLQTAYNFQGVERDGKLVFEQKRGTTDITVPEDDFIRSSRENIFEEERKDEKTVPRMIFLSYRSLNLKDETSTQHARQITDTYLTVGSQGDVSTELPLVLDDDEAKQIVERMLYESRLSLENFKYMLPAQYLRATPGDVVEFTAAGRTDQMRIAALGLGFNLEVDVEGYLIDGDVYNQNQAVAAIPYGSPSFSSSSVDQQPTPSVLGFALDLPPLRYDMVTGLSRTSGSYFGYIAGLPPVYSNKKFVGGAIQISYTEGSSFDTRQTTSTEAAYGIVTGTIPAIPTENFNGVQEASLTMSSGGRPDQFVSVTQQEMIGQQLNTAILFNPAANILEVIRFRDVVDIPSSSGIELFRLTGLMRGQRGTDTEALRWATEASGPTYLFLADPNTLRVYTEPLSRQGDVVNYRSVAIGTEDPVLRNRSLTVQLRGLKPFAPVHVALLADNSGADYILQWERRTRGEGAWRNATGAVELEEDTEAYEVDILDGSGGSVVRTLSSTTPSVVYTDAQITTDFGSLPVPLYARVYQISAQVGRGYSHEVALLEE